MPESWMKSQLKPQPKTEPKETQQPMFMIDVSVEDVDMQLTPEEQEALRRYESRKALVKPWVDAVIPDRTPEQYIESVAKKYKKTVDLLDHEDRDKASYAYRSARFDKQQLIDRIAQTEVADQDLSGYVTALYTLTTTILPNGSELSSADIRRWIDACETTKQTQFHQRLAEQWKAKFMVGVDEKTARQRMQDFQSLIVDLTGCNIYPRPEARNAQTTKELFTAFTELYEQAYSISGQRQEDDIDRLFRSGAESVGLTFNDPEQTRLMLQLYQEVSNYPDREIGKKFADDVVIYAKHHGLSTEKIRGFVDKLLPAMQNNDPQVEILLRGGNIWGMKRGDFGVGDYLCHAYASPITSSNLNELLLAAREVPTTNLSRLEQNRIDALTMSAPFGILRDFIHDQRPHVNEVLTAMIHYYDTGDRTQLESVLPKADYFNSDKRIQTMFDKSKYDLRVEDRAKPRSWVKSVEVLRRLVENTKPVPDIPPTTSDEKLNKKLQTLEEELIGRRGVSKETLTNTIDYINQQLFSMMSRESVGIEPNHIMAISWVERRVFQVLQTMKYEDQTGAYKQEWFLSILRFQELIGSLQFNEQEFQNFIQILTDSNLAIEAYKLIGRRTLENIQKLATRYKQKGRTDSGALWSGNLAHELVGLVDFKTAQTEQGRKFRNESAKQITEPGYHPGD